MSKSLFVTGNSSGLGRGFSEYGLGNSWQVYGCSRRGCDLDGVHDVECDLADFGSVAPALDKLFAGVKRLDLVILNADILGEIKPMHDTSLDDLKRIMDINVWSNFDRIGCASQVQRILSSQTPMLAHPHNRPSFRA
ncbi:MAG: SDR family NAD(P)-dependent oxidoreductase [Pseudomonadota bacterium]